MKEYFELHDQLEAENIWIKFFQKYSAPDHQNYYGKRDFFSLKMNAEEGREFLSKLTEGSDAKKSTKLENAASLIQARWRFLHSKDTLVTVNPKGFYTPNFSRFINNQDIKKSLNTTKLKLLEQAIHS